MRKVGSCICLVLVSGFWFLTSGIALAQDTPGIVDDVIKRIQQDLGTEPPDQPTNPAPPEANTPPPQPQTIPGIVTQGDNATLLFVPPPPPTYEDRPSVILRALDKVTARTQTLEVPVGQQFNFGALTIAVRACRSRPPLEPSDSAAFLQIVEQKPGEPMEARFSGWMFSSSPSLSALEHPVYDVWVVGCGEPPAPAAPPAPVPVLKSAPKSKK